MYSLRTRSGSVGREPSSSSSAYRPTFSTRTPERPTATRLSRASSCDPSARSSSRPPAPGMSHSYHSDYSSRNIGSSSLSSRYGSVGNLSSLSTSTYRSPYSSSSRNESSYRRPEPTSSYRSTDSYRTSTYRASSTFSPRIESRLPPREFSSSSLNKYRPDTTTSYSRSNYSATPTSSYSARPRVDFRSKTPSGSEVTTRTSRFDREYKSLSRFEKTPSKDEKLDDEVENTFQKLYNRYVKNVDLGEGKKTGSEKKFTSHSETEATSEEDSASEMDTSFSEILRRRKNDPPAQSVTPKGQSPSLVTPTASPIPKKKVLEHSREEDAGQGQSVEDFRQKHSDVEMKPAVIEARVLKPAASAMSKMLSMDNLLAKVSDAFQRKKVEKESLKAVAPVNGTVKTPASPNDSAKSNTSAVESRIVPLPANKIEHNDLSANPTPMKAASTVAQEVATSKVPMVIDQTTPPEKCSFSDTKSQDSVSKAGFFKETTSASVPPASLPPTTLVTRRSSSPKAKSPLRPAASEVIQAQNGTKSDGSASAEVKKAPNRTVSLTVPTVSGSGKVITQPAEVEQKKTSLLPSGGKARRTSPRPKPALTIDTKKAEEASTSVTILMPKGDEMSRSASPASTVDGEKTASAAERRKNRDRNRTLEHMLKEVATKREVDDKSSTGSPGTPSLSRVPPLLLVTQASVPSTPKVGKARKEEWGSGSGSYYGSDEDVDDEEEGWTEAEDEEDYGSDFEFCISETFRIPTKTDVNVYPPSTRASPFVSDYDSDCSASFLASQKWEDSRGRVDRLFAVPPPTFTCSVSYDGQESWESESVHSCEEEEDEELAWRPTSSSLGGYRSPGPFESDEDVDGDVQVGCTLKLVDKAALRGSGDSDSEYYDDEDEEYSDEEYWEEDEEYEEEYEEEEEKLEEYSDDDASMISAEEKSPSPTLCTASFAEEQLDFDETEDVVFETDFKMALPQSVEALDSTTAKYREVTYTRDLEMDTVEESTAMLSPEETEAVKAIAKKIKKDGTTETAHKNVVPQMVTPLEEILTLQEAGEVEMETLEMLSPSKVDAETGTGSVHVTPTFVRPQTEKVAEEFTSRFATAKPSTDFAKKAVIQPTKLEKAVVKETKAAEGGPLPKQPSSTHAASADESNASKAAPGKVLYPSKETKTTLAAAAQQKMESPTPPRKAASKPVEDKSAVRKSALNMKEEDAKKKAVADEEAARQKARRFGTVNALADKFKDKPTEEPIVYRRSSRLAPKEDEPRPRRKYEIVKPVINDEFDKQMEEIRAQMKAGSTQFQSDLKNLSKGISSVTEEAKKRELDDKHKQLLDKTTGVFGKADEEKQRWMERRVGKEKEPEQQKTPKKAEPVADEPKKEPKRTVRRIVKKETTSTVGQERQVKEEPSKPPAPPGAVPKATPVTCPEPPPQAQIDRFKRDRTPVVNPAETLKRPVAPKQTEIVVDDNNFALFQAATKVASRKKDSRWDKKVDAAAAELETKLHDQLKTDTRVGTSEKTLVNELKAPKSEGAVATKIRNALGNATNAPQQSDQRGPTKRYATRRKTQEIVNESVIQPKRKRRVIPRHGKFIGDPHDIDVLLGWNENSFEELEMKFKTFEVPGKQQRSKDRKRRSHRNKIWISDLTVGRSKRLTYRAFRTSTRSTKHPK